MESAMRESDDIDFLAFDGRKLTPEQWEHCKRYFLRRAQAARAQTLRDLAGGILATLQKVAAGGRDMVRNGWNAYAAGRERRRAVQELNALDDLMLKDIGVRRCEIGSVVYGRDSSRLTEGKVTAVLFQHPDAQPWTGMKTATKPKFKKNAA
jgi:uncharacterized protein YjiS (DUF1127 family)